MSVTNQSVRVYLDHLIPREPLLYKSITEAGDNQPTPFPSLRLYALNNDPDLVWQLRKPDFQRTTQAWSPTVCADLLESIVNEQVVPSVILWMSPDNFIYVLDGGHRISVLLAWLKDDWGEGCTRNMTPAELVAAREAATQVRKLLAAKSIGEAREYWMADSKFRQVEREHGREAVSGELSLREQKLANKVRRWRGSDIGFFIQWVVGNYETAEKSFVKINRTGAPLSDWETILVENRQSSFARLVMSIADPTHADRCWPKVDVPAPMHSTTDEVLKKSRVISNLLFAPEPLTANVKQDALRPLLGISAARPDLRPLYTAEVLTIVKGQKGQKVETEALMKADKSDSSTQIIINAQSLTSETIDALNSLAGPSPRSLSTAPLLYYYNTQGDYVRNLLYGMLYWINFGSDTDVHTRKISFSAYRGSFEDVLIQHKQRIIKRITRKIGSGSEVTRQTANYFDALLQKVIEFSGKINTPEFEAAHTIILETLTKTSSKSQSGRIEDEKVSSARNFPPGMKDEIMVKTILDTLPTCEICNGRLIATQNVQYDHKHEVGKGGPTAIYNGRIVHPFCNNNRVAIQKITIDGALALLPEFGNKGMNGQLSFPNFWGTDDLNFDEDDDETPPDDIATQGSLSLENEEN